MIRSNCKSLSSGFLSIDFTSLEQKTESTSPHDKVLSSELDTQHTHIEQLSDTHLQGRISTPLRLTFVPIIGRRTSRPLASIPVLHQRDMVVELTPLIDSELK